MIQFVLPTIMLVLVAACGNKEQAPPPPPPPPPPQVVAPVPAPVIAPAAESLLEKSPEPKAPIAAEIAKPGSDGHTVVKGDTLYSIAKKHGVKHQDLAKWNNITNPKRLRLGQKLRLSRT